MAPRIRVPILLLTGFLGSGKTSLLARWLRDPAFAGAMVIVNELGEVGLDDRLIETSSDTPLLLDSGCACCEAGEDLSATLERLFWDRLHRKIPQFSWVLIETTGIADPAPIIDRLERNSLVAERYELRGLATTFDAQLGPGQLPAHPECRSQLAHAGVIVLTKTDVASAAELAAARACLAKARPDARVLVSAQASVSAQALLDALAGRDETPHELHDHDHHHHGHVHAVHTEGVSSAFASLSGGDEAQLRARLSGALARHGDAILRLKGLVQLGSGDWRLVQATPGTLTLSAPPAQTVPPARSGVTLITRDLPAADIAETLSSGGGV